MTARRVAYLWLAILGCAILAVLMPHATPVAGHATIVATDCHAQPVGWFNPCASLDTTQVQDRRPSEAECAAVAARVFASQDYTGAADEVACLGQEDDARVGLALDYGQTEAGYAASEAAQG